MQPVRQLGPGITSEGLVSRDEERRVFLNSQGGWQRSEQVGPDGNKSLVFILVSVAPARS